MFASPLMRKNLPGLLEAVRADEELAALYKTRFVVPRRKNVGRLISEAVDRADDCRSDDSAEDPPPC